MPVGNSDKGVGLWAGQIMVSMDYNYQFIDWGHPPIAGEADENGNIVGHHLGTLSANVVSPRITIGLSDYWNITFSQIFGIRHMTWGKDVESVHHRDEDSNSNFQNANGGLKGDTRIITRYLAINDGAGAGKRLYFGGGLIIPSDNTLTSDPFFLGGDDVEPHRHFSMSEGVYKGIAELQYFVKRMSNPVFVGGTFSVEEPLSESEYGYKASRLVDVSITAFTKKVKYIGASMVASVQIRNTSQGYWNGIEAPNSESTIVTPSIGFLWNSDFGVLALNIQRPKFISGTMSGNEGSDQEETDVWQTSISFRKILDYSIPWLYW